MTGSIPDLRLLDGSRAAKELDLVSEVFQRINRVIPADQRTLTVAPNCPVRQAVSLMRMHGYSQVPVVAESGEVLGVFSYRSFAQAAAASSLDEWTKQRCAPADLPVDEFLEKFAFARVADEMSSVFDAMDRDNGVLIGTPERLVGILTPMDFLKYLYQVASPYVMVWEIELALRALIRSALTEPQIAVAAKRCLTKLYGSEDSVPVSLEEMTFDNYQALIAHGENWDDFVPIFGVSRARTSAKLKEVGEIRNDIFHFKREITIQDHEVLAGHRDWLLSKVKQAEAHRNKEARA